MVPSQCDVLAMRLILDPKIPGSNLASSNWIFTKARKSSIPLPKNVEYLFGRNSLQVGKRWYTGFIELLNPYTPSASSPSFRERRPSATPVHGQVKWFSRLPNMAAVCNLVHS